MVDYPVQSMKTKKRKRKKKKTEAETELQMQKLPQQQGMDACLKSQRLFEKTKVLTLPLLSVNESEEEKEEEKEEVNTAAERLEDGTGSADSADFVGFVVAVVDDALRKWMETVLAPMLVMQPVEALFQT